MTDVRPIRRERIAASIDRRSHRRLQAGQYLVRVFEATVVLAAVAYVASASVVVLIVWEVLARGYLLGGLLAIRRRSIRGAETPNRIGAFGTLSWVLPLAASLVGVNGAIVAITIGAPIDGSRAGSVVLAVTAVLGIILSWQLLHAGFAQVCESAQHKDPTRPGLGFPRKKDPAFTDFLYFSSTVGTFFATSDTKVSTTRMRWTVLTHSVVSFFYNVLVVAVAIHILQQLARS